jgi:hypothetical protein
VATRAFQQSAAGPSSYNASTAMQQPSMSGSQFSRSPPQPQQQEGGRVQLQQPQYQPRQQQQQGQGGGALVSSAEASSSGGSSTALKAKEQPKMVQARFWLKFHVDYGQCIRIIGGHEATGACVVWCCCVDRLSVGESALSTGAWAALPPGVVCVAGHVCDRRLPSPRTTPNTTGAWNLAKAPFLRWSEGDLWNVTLELAAGGVYEYKYVVVESDGVTAASWQRGANNVLALQMSDTEVEVYDNW